MTREEAIDLLDNLIGMIEDNHESDYDTALQMAKKALEFIDKIEPMFGDMLDIPKASVKPQEPCEDCISRQDAYKCLEFNGEYDTLNEAYERLQKLPSVKQESTGHKALEYDDAKYHEEHGEVIVDKAVWEDAERALEQEPIEDAISREDVINLKWQGEASEEFLEGYASAIEDARVLPSVNPQEKTGHWIMRHRKVNTINYRTGEDVLTGEIHTVKELIRYETDEPYCAGCGKRAEDISQGYCGYCGARMVEPQESEEV